MINQLFDWEYMDTNDSSDIVAVYTDCILKQDIGPYPKGTEFGVIVTTDSDSGIALYKSTDDEEPVFEAKLKIIACEYLA